MKPYAEAFYKSPQWKACRDGYMKKVGGLCERCLKKGLARAAVIVHHKEHITPENISDPNVTLSWDNLEALCRECHEQEHHKSTKRWKVDKYGRVLGKDIPPG